MNILVTGGAGFVGSHLIDRLIKESHRVVCVDDLSLGRMENIGHHKGNSRFSFIRLDITNRKKLAGIFRLHGFDCVFHMAANSDIQEGGKFTETDLKKTFLTTLSVLECMRESGVRALVFASSSAVYGQSRGPLSEESGPLMPVSLYGAAKLCSEAYISAFSSNFGIRAWILRFPNVIGERATHGVMFDFIEKLRKNPRELLILGDGRQKKPYLYVRDLVDGMLFAWKKASGGLNCFNLGVESSTTVDKIAAIITEEMGLKGVKLKYTGGDRGWTGDVPRFSYSLKKINRLGWKAERTSDGAVRLAVRAYLEKN